MCKEITVLPLGVAKEYAAIDAPVQILYKRLALILTLTVTALVGTAVFLSLEETTVRMSLLLTGTGSWISLDKRLYMGVFRTDWLM